MKISKLYVVLWDYYGFEGVFTSKQKAQWVCKSNMETVREIEVENVGDYVYVVTESPYKFVKVFSSEAESNNFIELGGFDRYIVEKVKLG